MLGVDANLPPNTRRGGLASSMPASWGVLSPLRLLQEKEQRPQILPADCPCLLRGRTWSSVRLPAGIVAPQYRQVLPSRRRIPLPRDRSVLPRHAPVAPEADHRALRVGGNVQCVPWRQNKADFVPLFDVLNQCCPQHSCKLALL